MTRTRAGFSLVEVLIAMSIIALLGGALMWSTMNTVSHSARAEDLMLEALIAQTVVSEIKDATVQNPNFFANLTTKYQFQETRPGFHQIFGSVTARRPEVSTPYGTLVPCNLFTDLPLRVMSQATGAGAELVDNLFAPLGYGQGPDPLGDFALRVTVGNQETPREFEGRTYFGGVMGEVLKTVTVEIYRVSDMSQAEWKPAYRVSHAMLTPVESLSAQATKELDQRYGTYDHRPNLEKLKEPLSTLPAFQNYSTQALDLYALFMLILREVNVEYCRSEARSIITGRLIGPRDQGLRRRIERLGTADSGYLKLERGRLMQEKLLLTFDTFRRAIGPLRDLLGIMQEIDAQAQDLKQDASSLNQESAGVAASFQRIMNVNGFNELLGRFTALQQRYGEQLQQNRQLLSTIRLMEYLLSRPHMEAAFERLRQYPSIFSADLKKTQEHFQALSQDRGASPLVRAVASREWISTSIAWRVARKEADLNGTDRTHLATLKAASQGSFPLLEDHTDQNHLLRALPDLEFLNEGFVLKQPPFKSLATRDGPPREISRTLEPRGSQTGTLDSVGTVPGTFYRIVVSAAQGARRVGMTPEEASARIGPTIESLKPVVEDSMSLGLTTPLVIRSGQPASQMTRIGRLRSKRSWRPGSPPVAAGPDRGDTDDSADSDGPDRDRGSDLDDPLPPDALVVDGSGDEPDFEGPALSVGAPAVSSGPSSSTHSTGTGPAPGTTAVGPVTPVTPGTAPGSSSSPGGSSSSSSGPGGSSQAGHGSSSSGGPTSVLDAVANPPGGGP